MDDTGGAGEDPFDAFLPLCHVSSSQEELLRRRAFAPERDNPESGDESEDDSGSGGIRIASTPIMLVSLPESEENEFHTPPEEAAMSSSGEVRAAMEVDGRGEVNSERRGVEEGNEGGENSVAAAMPVDLSRDSELGFSEVEVAQREKTDSDVNRLNSEVFNSELGGDQVLNKEATSGSGLRESPLKRLKISEQNSEEPNEELEIVRNSSSDRSFDINTKRRSAKRKLELRDDENSEEVVPLDSNGNYVENNLAVEANQERISPAEFLEAMNILKNSTSETQETRNVELRRLPCSITGQAGKVARATKVDESHRKLTILDVLKLLKEDSDNEILSCSFLDIYNRRRITSSQRGWQPEKETGFRDDNIEAEIF